MATTYSGGIANHSPFQQKRKQRTFIGVDIETSIRSGKDQKVLEIALIACDRHHYSITESLNLVVHFDREYLERHCDPWQLRTFSSIENGGNGLIDDCCRSTTDFETVQNLIVSFIQKHTTSEFKETKSTLDEDEDEEKQGVRGKMHYDPVSVFGASVHFDRSMLLRHFPKLRTLIHHQVRDVTTIHQWVLEQRPFLSAHLPRSRGSHRALADIEDSACLLQALTSLLFPRYPASMQTHHHHGHHHQQHHQQQQHYHHHPQQSAVYFYNT